MSNKLFQKTVLKVEKQYEALLDFWAESSDYLGCSILQHLFIVIVWTVAE